MQGREIARGRGLKAGPSRHRRMTNPASWIAVWVGQHGELVGWWLEFCVCSVHVAQSLVGIWAWWVCMGCLARWPHPTPVTPTAAPLPCIMPHPAFPPANPAPPSRAQSRAPRLRSRASPSTDPPPKFCQQIARELGSVGRAQVSYDCMTRFNKLGYPEVVSSSLTVPIVFAFCHRAVQFVDYCLRRGQVLACCKDMGGNPMKSLVFFS